MALALTTNIETIDATVCPVLAGLIPGKEYRLTNLTQGSLGTYSIIAVAQSATQLSASVRVFPASAPATLSGWDGLFDYSSCQLIYIHDNDGNQISGATNISVFPFFPASTFRVRYNVVDASSTLDLGGNSFAGQFLGNQVLSNSSVVVSGNVITSTEVTINYNLFSKSQFSAISTVVLRLIFTNNNVNQSTIFEEGSESDIGDVFISNNEFSSSTAFLYGNGGTSSVENNTILGGNITIAPVTSNSHTVANNIIKGTLDTISTVSLSTITNNSIDGIVTIGDQNNTVIVTDNVFGPASEVTTFILGTPSLGDYTVNKCVIDGRIRLFVEENGMLLQLNYSHIANSAQTGASYDFDYRALSGSDPNHSINFLTMLPGALADFSCDGGPGTINHVLIAQGGRISNSGPSAAPQLINVYVESGFLELNNFSATGVRLQNANSFLIANVANAKKDGYVGALP